MSSADPAVAVETMCESLAGFDAAVYSGDDAARLHQLFSRGEKVLAAARLQAGARAAECGAHRDRGFSNPSEWVARETGDSAGRARAELELASRLDENPQLRAAVGAGDVSLQEGVEIAKTEAECPGSTPEMLDTAKRRGLRGVKERGRRKRHEAQDPEALARRQHQARGLRRWVDELGMRCGEYRLPPEIGIPFEKRLDAETERQWRAGDERYRREPRERRAADAFATLIEGKGKPHAKKPELVAVYDLNSGRAHLPAGGPITHQTVRDLATDALVSVVLHDGDEVKTFKRYGPHIPAPLRTLLEIGNPPDFDGPVCVDCHRRFALEDDHVNPRANHGETSYDNVKPRCPECHRAKTERDRQAGLLGNNGNREPTRTDRAPP